MRVTGIICEYNPLHLGHQKQLDLLKQDEDTAVVCCMSGYFVQRGAPAIFDKMARAEAAVRCGADLVLELPVTAALSSAEGFAAKGVSILSPFCQQLSFGAEDADPDKLMGLAGALLDRSFPDHLHDDLTKGLSFPAARQAAIEKMGYDGSLLEKPNNILAVEYCKAILSQGSTMTPMPIKRSGSYHDTEPDSENPSATAVREQIYAGKDWHSYIPAPARPCFDGKTVHAISNGESAILARLRTMTEAEFEALPYGSEGLWRKLMHAVREKATLDEIIDATKTKRYTRTRLDRMVMCAFLGITEKSLNEPAPYTRVLALNDTGREILKTARLSGVFVNAGEIRTEDYQLLEDRCGDLYGLFAKTPESAGRARNERVIYIK